jgi:adrenodoxin-NADP+ reductase
LYAAGWLKRGPIGVIATTMADAYQTGDTIVADWTGGQAMLNNDQEAPKDQRSTNPVLDLLHSRGHKTVSYADWKKIEQKEFELGAKVDKPREKFLSVEEMLKVLD